MEVQKRWAAIPISRRLAILKSARYRLAAAAQEFASTALPELGRTTADTLAAEVLPLLEACKFLENRAAKVLRTNHLGRSGLPFWLLGTRSEVRRVPFGTVLIIGPSNYPLLLPGVQALQALAAGNAVIWKPGRGGKTAADIFARALAAAGLPQGLLRVTEDSVDAAEQEIARGVDKVFFTGSAQTGQALLRRLAEMLIPCVAELSGCDAVVVLPSADLHRVVKALAFGMRLNGSATCMAPRRVLLVDAGPEHRQEFLRLLTAALDQVRAVPIAPQIRERLRELLADASHQGAEIVGDLQGPSMKPVLVLHGRPSMAIANADIFAPVLTVISVEGVPGVVAAHEACDYALTTSIFGTEVEARAMAEELQVGTVLINDLIVPTADPRVPFGGRRRSGFGVTRGIEGLLEMTAVQVIAARRGRSTRHYDASTALHDDLFRALVTAMHGSSLPQRWRAVKQVIEAGRKMQNQRRGPLQGS